MRIDDLNTDSTTSDVKKALSWIAGMPRTSQAAFLDQLVDVTGRKHGNLDYLFRPILQARKTTKYPRVRLKTFLVDKGVDHEVDGSDIIVADPLEPGDKLRVRDNVLLGHDAVICKSAGYAHPIDDYITAFIGADDIKTYLIPEKEIKALAKNLSNCDLVKLIPAQLRAQPNVLAFEQVLKNDSDKRLLCALRMNARYCLVDNAGEIVIFDSEKLVSYKQAEFKAKLRTEIEWIGGKPFPRSDVWLSHPARVLYEELVFAPRGRDVNGCHVNLSDSLNLWSDYAEAGAAGDWSLTKRHIKTILCNGNEEAYEYLLSWLAHLFQKPWDKPGVAIVVWGRKRTGKGTVADAIRHAIGSELAKVFIQKEHVIGRFASSSRPPMFNQLEEATFAKDPREEGPLKSKITDPHETVELKFKTPYQVSSFSRYWFNSNSPTPVPITYDEERYFVLHVSPEKANDHEYFAAIRKELYEDGGLAAMVHELSNRSLEGFKVRKPPHTAERADMVIAMLSPQDRAIADILISGELQIYNPVKAEVVKSVELEQHAYKWVDKEIVRAVLNDSFRRHKAREASQADIRKVLMELGIIDASRNAHSDRGQKAAYRFLPLSKARQAFAKARELDVAELFAEEQAPSPDPLILIPEDRIGACFDERAANAKGPYSKALH